ncbi:MAG: hypothetical protein HY259_03065 [Chloroflexi bacterium]|nr:hypothetical protein [Chloroflexota bacterium]
MDDLPAIETPKTETPDRSGVSAVIPIQPIGVSVANETPFVSTNEPANARTKERRKIRHTFDILADQLLSLREIAIAREKTFGQRVLLGELMQEALDLFIARERNKE